ncbi:hypothetical protein CAL18_12560 [Bordetella genomosp. 7]|uniref:Uncharacterized protein n=1 Tax=Bordetella genomosp. 7 TaxID=1416805 RepID=A0A261QYU2_9BORD|nr:hypothetical protein [Bordetella genomosp. 7]OZI17958.1 hypothetical protein CAL19_12830 [Bordetella genomosp. 7]OZI21749.1 hypothetical protein CAL18_12560 [Bordetella genomosp. 7]
MSEELQDILEQYRAMRVALEKLLELPYAKEQLRFLDGGIGTKTRNAVWLEARHALATPKGEPPCTA